MCVEHKLEIEFQQKVEKYTCMQDKGEQQTESFKALDFADHWTTNLYCFNVCRAQIGSSGTCGLRIPSQLWKQEDPNRWRFKCHVDWEKLLKSQRQHIQRIRN